MATHTDTTTNPLAPGAGVVVVFAVRGRVLLAGTVPAFAHAARLI